MDKSCHLPPETATRHLKWKMTESTTDPRSNPPALGSSIIRGHHHVRGRTDFGMVEDSARWSHVPRRTAVMAMTALP